MEKRIFIYIRKLFWLAITMQLAAVLAATNVTDSTQVVEDSIVNLYAWSAWGSWSACSRSCGGGVSVQERQCLPRSRNLIVNETGPTTTSTTVRVTRQATNDCLGVSRRYHECNTHVCLGGERDVRAEQCSSYDRRPFRGRFYTWVPYIDGDSPCLLNCRPLGQQFYATLALVADGAPCTRVGYRAICVQGSCKVVGREVLSASGSRDVRCGRRLVSGLFARPRLPLGYSYITTVPTGACRLNISEIVASDNYIAVENIITVTDEFCLTEFAFALDIHLFAVNGPLMKANGPQTLALKITNGSYIMNGEFAVSTPGTYEAAGARFVYTREAGLDSVFALGPTQYDIDIMILYTHPNPNIKYEYFTESLPGEIDIESVTKSNLPEFTITTKHTRRHHGFDSYLKPKYPDSAGLTKDVSSEGVLENVIGERKFVWKILSYTQCSRSCGGGIQVGKYRCVEVSSTGDREISPVHCTGTPLAGKRRRCGGVPCAPRWRAAAWSSCPQCGPATRTRIVGCVQDHSKGITKVSDQKCPTPKPSTIDTCNIPDCSTLSTIRHIERTNPRVVTDTFRDGPVYSIAVNASEDIGPEYSFGLGVGSWLYTDWSECVGWCVGGGLQTRAIRCADPSGCPHKAPDTSRACTPSVSCEPHDGHWFTGEWSPCSSTCGGKQVRGVLCIGGSGRHLRDSACKEPKPAQEQSCGGECPPQWYYSDWGQCTGNCTVGAGVQRRTVVCTREGGAASERDCPAPPAAARACVPPCDSVIPPDITIESQKSATELPITTQRSTQPSIDRKDCEDKLSNCVLAVQARLCHYKYYIQNCCDSCRL